MEAMGARKLSVGLVLCWHTWSVVIDKGSGSHASTKDELSSAVAQLGDGGSSRHASESGWRRSSVSNRNRPVARLWAVLFRWWSMVFCRGLVVWFKIAKKQRLQTRRRVLVRGGQSASF